MQSLAALSSSFCGGAVKSSQAQHPRAQQQAAQLSRHARPLQPVLAAVASPASEQAASSASGSKHNATDTIARLVAQHPSMEITLLTANRQAGQKMTASFPHLIGQELPVMVTTADADWSSVDAVFCCLPHATTQEILQSVPEHLKIVDLSADFRLRDIKQYAEWYGGEHKAPELQKEAVYGLTELYREQVRSARLVANPGCYPTSVQLPLSPLLQDGLITNEDIIIDAKSGVSGAGRSAKEANLYVEIAEGINAYGVSKHRHVPEIEQGLADFAKGDVKVSFTPHLMPMSRGMQSTMYVKLASGATADDLRKHLQQKYEEEPFVNILPKGVVPHTRHVRGSNYCLISVFEDRLSGRAILISVIDNLVKGASGQAMQNMNIMMGLPETTGLLQAPMFP
eukprot:jgi/Chlat1/4880/Chrsp31S04894